MTKTPLLLPAREAAKHLAICEKSLWSITAPRGPLPCIRIGRSVRYSTDDLQRYIDQQRSVVQ